MAFFRLENESLAPILDQIRNQNTEAFACFQRRFEKRVLAIFRRDAKEYEEFAEEFTNLFFTIIYTELAVRQRPVPSPAGWLNKILKNLECSLWKKVAKYRRMRPVLEGDDGKTAHQEPDTKVTPEYVFDRRLRLERVNQAFLQMPLKYQQALELWSDGNSYPEISEILDIPLGTVKSYIRRGREMIHRKLGSSFDID